MKVKREDYGYWAGWFVAFGMVALFLIYVIWKAFSLEAYACSENESDCVREWVSALGGWVGGVLALPTILFLARQVRDANRFQQQNLQVQLRKTRAIAARAKRSAAGTREFARNLAQQWDDDMYAETETKAGLWHYVRTLDMLSRSIDNPLFDLIENEVAPVEPLPLSRVREVLALDMYRSIGEPELAPFIDLVTPEDLRTMMKNQCEMVEAWTASCEEQCSLFLEQSAEMTGLAPHAWKASST